MQCNVCKGWNTEFGACWDCHAEEGMMEYERRNKWYRRLGRWILRGFRKEKNPVIDSTISLSTYDNPDWKPPTLDELHEAYQAIIRDEPHKMINCVKHGWVPATKPDRNLNGYCSVCREYLKMEFQNQMFDAEVPSDLKKPSLHMTSMGYEVGFGNTKKS